MKVKLVPYSVSAILLQLSDFCNRLDGRRKSVSSNRHHQIRAVGVLRWVTWFDPEACASPLDRSNGFVSISKACAAVTGLDVCSRFIVDHTTMCQQTWNVTANFGSPPPYRSSSMLFNRWRHMMDVMCNLAPVYTNGGRRVDNQVNRYSLGGTVYSVFRDVAVVTLLE